MVSFTIFVYLEVLIRKEDIPIISDICYTSTLSRTCCLMMTWFHFSGDRLSDEEMDQIIKMTKIEEDLDGNVKYEGMHLHR